jgi:hypothetical protein
MDVMGTRVHHSDLDTACIGRTDFGCIGDTRLFGYWEAIEIGTEHDHGSRAVLEYRHVSRFTDAGGDTEIQGLKTFGKLGRCFVFLEGQLRSRMKLAVQFYPRGEFVL